MAAITEQQKKIYSAFMQELWGLVKKYRNPEPGDAYWNAMIKDCSALSDKYQGDEIITHLLMGLCEGLEAEHMNRKDSEE